MSAREQALNIFNQLTEEQLAAFVTLFKGANQVPEEIPDKWDAAMISESSENNSEAMPFDNFVKELGFNPDDLQD